MLNAISQVDRKILGMAFGGWAGLAVAHLLERYEDSKRAESESVKFAPLDEKGQFFLMLANVVFRIDGTISTEEQSYLDVHSANAPEQVRQRIASMLGGKNVFVEIRNWYEALSEADGREVAAEAQRLIKIDAKCTEEERAFLVQLAQIIEGHDQLELLVSSTQHKTLLFDHGLFRYIAAQDFSQCYPHSSCGFHEGSIYTPHPYLTGSLIPFAVEDFESAQDQLFNGIIELLKELDAKSVLVSEYTKEKQADKEAASATVEGGNAVAKVKVSGGASTSYQQLLHSTQDAKVEFDGSKRTFLDRLKVSNLEQDLLRKYRNNPQCQTIIKARFGHNKASYFEYKFKSTEARSIAKGMNAAAKLDHKLVKGGVKGKADATGSYTRTIEKNLVIYFH